MSQTTLDDELFDEAAGELEADVEAALEEARSALPDADELWAVEADNVLGVLNGLRADLTAEDAGEQLREARKWYEMGRRADAFEDGDLGADIEAVEELFEQLEAAKEHVSALTGTLPEVKGALEEFEDG
jgi:hypothetical protein